MLGFTKGGVGYVIVKTSSLYDNKTGYKGVYGKELLSDVTYDKQRHARTYGIVVQLPVEMGGMPIYQIMQGVPGYGPIRKYVDHDMEDPHPAIYATGRYKYKFMSDIEPEVQLGDLVYFSWRLAYSKDNILAMSNDPDPDKREYLLKIPYDQIYCSVRDGKIIPIGSYVFIDPEVETWEDVLTPTYYHNQVGADGKPIPRPKEEWIQTKRFPENKDRYGTVMHVGSPLKGEKCSIQVGDRVIYKVQLKNTKTIEGIKYMVIPQRKILLKLKSK